MNLKLLPIVSEIAETHVCQDVLAVPNVDWDFYEKVTQLPSVSVQMVELPGVSKKCRYGDTFGFEEKDDLGNPLRAITSAQIVKHSTLFPERIVAYFNSLSNRSQRLIVVLWWED